MVGIRNRNAFAFVAVLLAVAAGCQNTEPQVDVEVCGDADVPRRVDALRVSLLDSEREPRREAIIPLLECPEAEVRPLPQSVSFRPFDGEAWAVVRGLRDGRPVSSFERRLELDAEQSASVQLAVNRVCLGITSCPAGQTCIGGECTLAPRSGSPATRCESTERDDSFIDSGRVDDTDVERDGGRDGPTDTSRDTDSDASRDSISTMDSGVGRDTSIEDPAALCPGADTGPSTAADGDSGAGDAGASDADSAEQTPSDTTDVDAN